MPEETIKADDTNVSESSTENQPEEVVEDKEVSLTEESKGAEIKEEEKPPEETEVKPKSEQMIPIVRFNEVYRKGKESERKAEHYQKLYEESLIKKPDKEPEKIKINPEPEEPEEPEEPDIIDFETNEDYKKAKEEYKKEKAEYRIALREWNKKQNEKFESNLIDKITKKQSESETLKTKEQKIEKIIKDGSKKYKGFEEALAKGMKDGDIQINGAMEDMILSTDNAPDIMYYLINNLDICNDIYNISRVNPFSASMKLAEISYGLKSKKLKIEIPDVINPVGSGEIPKREIEDLVNNENLDISEYVREKEKREGVKILKL